MVAKAPTISNWLKPVENEDAKQEDMQKQVAAYQANLSAWMANRMEKDKQVLTLSALGIGLLVTLRSELDDVCAFWVWLFAGGAFLLSVISILCVFQINSIYIKQIIRNDDKKKKEYTNDILKLSTWFADLMFAIGVIFTVLLVGAFLVGPTFF